ncbi:MAG: hypothetical protein KatS3mg105_1601 [Gemmatales bacterium]|nr:MAG: hypothetical protein KatS3mg105_1601 [Gemmatales bacterium]
MKCRTIRRQLLNCEDVHNPPAIVQQHLVQCSACRTWQGRLLHIEKNVAYIPIPESTFGRAQLFYRLRSVAAGASPEEVLAQLNVDHHENEEDIQPLTLTKPISPPKLPYQPFDFRKNWRYVAASAAAVLLLVVGWWVLIPTHQPLSPSVAHKTRTEYKEDPLLAKLVQLNVLLTSSEKEADRIAALRQIGRDLEAEAQTLGESEQELRDEFGQMRQQINTLLAKHGFSLKETARFTSEQADAERIEKRKQNRKLVRALVDGSMRMVEENDTLKRINYCSELANVLAGELRQAAQRKASHRALEMGKHLGQLLEHAVAKNLAVVRKSRSLQADEIKVVSSWVSEVTAPIEDELRDSQDENLQKALQVVHKGHKEVERALGQIA